MKKITKDITIDLDMKLLSEKKQTTISGGDSLLDWLFNPHIGWVPSPPTCH